MATHSTTTAVGRLEAERVATAVYTDGMLAGVAGGLTIAAWFLLLDTWAGRPFYTPTVLGAAVFHAGAGVDPATVRPSLDLVLPFTWLHVLIFATIGVVASRLLALAERNPNYGFGVLLFFVFFEIGFVAVCLALAEQVLSALAWPAVVVGNLLAAAAMTAVLWRRHPNLRVLP
jgi:hypothetical protein